jgi:Tol biopolymer transport system component
MRATLVLLALSLGLLCIAVVGEDKGKEPAASRVEPPLERKPLPKETRLKKLWQLTFGGENAEAYWSFDETKLIFQSTRPPFTADQIFIMGATGKDPRLVSTGKGRTICAYFLPGDKRILYASTHLGGEKPPPPPDHSKGYVWALYPSYDIFVADADGKNPERLTKTPGYDAEATVSPKGDRIVFTSLRDGDIELYSMKLDGSDVKRLTNRPGYDGGAFFSFDGKKIVWRAPGADDDVSKTDYSPLLKRSLVRPSRLEIWIMDADGGNKKQITKNGKANFGPFWHPDNRRVIFASNMDAPRGMNFDLYLVDTETLLIERVTYFARRREGARRSDDFDGFPVFTRDGKRLVFCSNRHNDKPNETNVFLAEWAD